jgi:hypothetical protein
VVSQGQFEVHDFYHATVVAFFAFGYLKDASFSQQPASLSASAPVPPGCTGTAPDANCFTPLQANKTFQADVVLGPLYYLKKVGNGHLSGGAANRAAEGGRFRRRLGVETQ